MKDYYKILAIPENASQQEIKSAFRRLAFKHHPDTNPGNERQAEQRFKEINEAYAVLSDEAKRQRYDLARKGRFTGQGYQGFDYSQRDIFQGIFTNRATLDELNRMFSQAGLRFDRDFLNRVFFGGRGTVFRFYSSPDAGQPFTPQAKAYRPNWFERTLARFMARLSRFMLKRLFGIDYTGDLDLHTRLELSPEEAAIGSEKLVSYKRGGRTKRLAVKIPPGVKTGTRIRLKGMGLAENKGAGNLYLHIEVQRHHTKIR